MSTTRTFAIVSRSTAAPSDISGGFAVAVRSGQVQPLTVRMKLVGQPSRYREQ
jgi:hypothetical protein